MAAVLAFGREEEPSSPLVTVFCVQAFWRDRAKLAKGRFEQFPSMESALRAGKAAALRAPAVVVYRVRGNAEAGFWEEPVVLAALGEAAQARREGRLEPLHR